MGTRADFYVGRGTEAEWLGSVAWDGYPLGLFSSDGLDSGPMSEDRWRQLVSDHLAARKDGTTPAMGWPWPWDDSGTTDYAYAHDDGTIHGSCFGRPWFVVDPSAENFGEPEEDERRSVVFPDMAARKNVAHGARSGVMFISLPD